MCTAIYIAAQTPLPLVKWREESPAFYVAELDSEADIVRTHFSGGHVYYVGSYQGCGCGLSYQPYPGGDEEEADQTRKDWMLFAEYLNTVLRKVAVIELFTCWEGDQHEPPQERVTITSSEIRDGRFEYDEGTYARIEKRI